MSVSTLTFTGSDEQIEDGIPQSVIIESNVPSIIYYTIDGTTPTINSAIYIDAIDFPDNRNSVTLSAFGVDGDGVSGPILTQVFAPNTMRISVSRNVGVEGYVINRADSGDDTPTGFDVDSNTARFVDVDIDTLNMQIKRTVKGFDGIDEGNAILVGIPNPTETPSLYDDQMIPFATTEEAQFFNPKAKVIYIDNRIDNEVQLTLRPFGSLSDPYTEFGGKRIRESADDATYITGGFVRRFYSLDNNIMYSLYYDNNENRWVKNIQELPSGTKEAFSINPSYGGRHFVFQWVYRGKPSSL